MHKETAPDDDPSVISDPLMPKVRYRGARTRPASGTALASLISYRSPQIRRQSRARGTVSLTCSEQNEPDGAKALAHTSKFWTWSRSPVDATNGVVEPFDFAAVGARKPTSRARVLEVRIRFPRRSAVAERAEPWSRRRTRRRHNLHAGKIQPSVPFGIGRAPPELLIRGFGSDGSAGLFGQTKEARARPMRSGNPFGDHGQRAIVLTFILKSIPANEDGVGMPVPLTDQSRAGFQDGGIEGPAFLPKFSG